MYRSPKGNAVIIVDGTPDSEKLLEFTKVLCKKWKYILTCLYFGHIDREKVKDTDELFIKSVPITKSELKNDIIDIIDDNNPTMVLLPRIRSLRSSEAIYTHDMIKKIYLNSKCSVFMMDIPY